MGKSTDRSLILNAWCMMPLARFPDSAFVRYYRRTFSGNPLLAMYWLPTAANREYAKHMRFLRTLLGTLSRVLLFLAVMLRRSVAVWIALHRRRHRGNANDQNGGVWW